MRQGIKAASENIILIQDADLEYDPSDYSKLVEPIKNDYTDVVYGSRFIGSGNSLEKTESYNKKTFYGPSHFILAIDPKKI